MTIDSPPPPLRLLVCLLYYLPHRTGLTIYVQQMAERLAERGHQVTVLCARHAPDTPLGESRENGVRVVRLWPAPWSVSRGMIMPGYPLRLWSLLRDCDAVSVHTPMLETALVGWMARRAGKPLVATHHGDLVLPAGRRNRLIGRWMLSLFRAMARRSAALVGHTGDYARNSSYLSPFLDKVEVIPPFVDIPPPDRARAADLRRRWASEGGPVIGFAGRFVEEKRPDLLIRSLETVSRRFPGVRIVFAGQHLIPYESYWDRQRDLVERFASRLTFLGVVPSQQAMADFYAACDVLALPSDTECFALVQVEAMLCGTPVVMTDTPGGRVPVQTTGMGRIVRRGDAEALGEGLLEVLSDRARFVRPRAEIRRHFSVEATVDAYERLFRRVVSAPPSPRN